MTRLQQPSVVGHWLIVQARDQSKNCFRQDHNLEIIHRLRQAGVHWQEFEAVGTVKPLAGLTFVITGTLQSMTREQAKAMSEDFQKAQGELDVATKRDLKELGLKIEARFEGVRGELTLIKWMLGLLLGGVLALILKAFFPG
jgi:hypothetical protein